MEEKREEARSAALLELWAQASLLGVEEASVCVKAVLALAGEEEAQ